MIKTFDLIIFMKDKSVEYLNISRAAVKYYIEWYQENENFYGYDLEDH